MLRPRTASSSPSADDAPPVSASRHRGERSGPADDDAPLHRQRRGLKRRNDLRLVAGSGADRLTASSRFQRRLVSIDIRPLAATLQKGDWPAYTMASDTGKPPHGV